MTAPISRAGSPAARASLCPFRSASVFGLLLAAFAPLLPSVAAHAQIYTETLSIHGDYAGSNEAFGLEVAADGDTIVVGTPTGPMHGPYRGYVFVKGPTGWTKQQNLWLPSSDVAIDGDTLVGGGDIYVRAGGTWTLQQSLNTIPDPIAALQGDTLVVGTPDNPMNTGAVYVFQRTGTTWTQQADFHPNPGTESMGGDVAIDGHTVIASVGSNTGGAYVYVRNGTAWTQQARLVLPTSTPTHTQVAIEGDIAAVSDLNNGKVYVFNRSGTTWTQAQILSKPSGASGYYGYKLALNGGVLAVGSDGVFYLYVRNASGWALAQTVVRPGYTFEGGIALANEGALLVAGNPAHNSSTGVVDVISNPPPPAPGSGWREADIGAVGQAGGSTVNGITVEVRGSGADIWNNADQFHFRSESLTGDGAIIARIDAVGAGDVWAKVGLMFRESLAPASRNVMVLVTPGGVIGMQSRVATAATSTHREAGRTSAPVWLMLARSGDLFGTYRSTDGENWTPMASATMRLPETLHAGLAVTSHNNAALMTGTYSNVELVSLEDPPADTLTGSALGTLAVPASHSEAGGVITVDAAGADIYGTADNGYFAHREITGDFDLRARVTSLTNTHPWAKAGIMVRESLAPGSRNLFTLVTAANAACLQVRSATSAATTYTAGPWVRAPYWVRLVRTGDNFQGFISADGTTWRSIGTTTLALPATLRAGLAVSSHVANTATRATFTELQLGE